MVLVIKHVLITNIEMQIGKPDFLNAYFHQNRPSATFVAINNLPEYQILGCIGSYWNNTF